MLDEMKREVYEANISLVKHNLVILTWGNVSMIDRKSNLIVIKPSGVNYEEMTEDDMVVVDLNGKVIEGKYKPSSDTPTHIELYKAFKDIGSVVHTHSKWATSYAQARTSIKVLGTTQADYFNGDIPCTRLLTEKEINGEYEKETGKVIVETFNDKNPNEIPAVLVASHGPFVWGKNPLDAVKNSLILEEIAFMNYHSENISKEKIQIQKALLNKHYYRKHGKNAYYGQNDK